MEETTAKQSNTALANAMADASSSADLTLFREMADKGVLFGHKKNRTHPRFRPFVFTTRNGMEIIDLNKTTEAIEEAAAFLKKLVVEKKTVLVIGLQPSSWDAVEDFVKVFDFPKIKNRWIGGFLTNFKIVYLRLEAYRKMQSGMAKGEYEKYTKKERVMLNKQIERMKEMFEGLDQFSKLPDAVIIIDTSIKGHATALREARIMKIPVVAIIDSDDDPSLVDYPIPANDHAKSSIAWILEKLAEKIKING